jgi:hypothetical protein
MLSDLYEGIKLGQKWVLNQQPHGPVHTVFIQTAGSGGLSITFQIDGDDANTVERAIPWIKANMTQIG